MNFDSLAEGLKINTPPPQENNEDEKNEVKSIFTVEKFIKELKVNSNKKNMNYHATSDRFNSYDIAHSCIRQVLFRIFKYPLKDYSDSWLPVKLRTNIGSACHDFIQESSLFTELEVYLRVLSKNISVKLDCLINNNILVEIKTCNYDDYDKIIKTNTPRLKDIYQVLLYKYLLENFIKESRTQQLDNDKYNLPKFDEYKIDSIQFIYICHELVAADTESISEDIEFAKRLKKFINSKNNKFWFIKTITLDLSVFDVSKITDHIVDKLEELNKYYLKKEIPDMKNKYVDLKSCFFCLFKKVCKENP